MADAYDDATGDYLSSTRSVLQAAKRLRGSLDADVARRDHAITRLEQAAEQQEGGAAGFRSFMFSELEAAPETEKALRERVQENTLASVSADLHVANVLMAAGETVGETGEEAEPGRLDEAILDLDNTTQAIEQSLPSSPVVSAGPGSFGFVEPDKSSSLPSASRGFVQRTDEVLTALISEARGAVLDLLGTLSNIDGAKVLEAISRLGGSMSALPKIGRLIRRGIRKMEAAVNALVNLMGSDALASIKDELGRFWEDFKEGKQLEALLRWSFGVEAAQARVTEMLRKDGLTSESLDRGSAELAELPTRFKESMKNATSLAAAVTLAGTLLALVPAIGGTAVLVAASIDVLILASVVLIGRDFTDSGDVLGRVDGVCEIAGRLQAT